MKWDTREPCESCPYRKDAKREFWHPDHFKQLLEDDAAAYGMGAMYGCHATRKREEPSICAGWLINQIRRDFPSNMLRVHLIRRDDANQCVLQVTDGGHELYRSIEAMIEANFPGLLVRPSDLLRVQRGKKNA